MRTVNLKVGALNADPNGHEAYWGFYGNLPLGVLPGGQADLYDLGLERDAASFQQGIEDQVRHSFGARLRGNPRPWDYNYEVVLQTGSFGDADILAWTVATDAGYKFDTLSFHPRVGLKVDLASGDRDPDEYRLGTFNALFPKQPYFSEAALIAPANIIYVHPTLDVPIEGDLSFGVDWNFLWKQRVVDYGCAVSVLTGGVKLKAGLSMRLREIARPGGKV